MLKNQIQNSLLRVFGFFLLIVSIFYLIKVLSKLEITFSDFLSLAKERPSILLSCTLLYVFTYLSGSLIWTLWVLNFDDRKNNKRMDCLNLMAVYFYTNMHKYIPGNFFQFVGRNLKGREFGFSHKSLISASLLEVVFSIGTGLLFVLLISPLFWAETKKTVEYFNIELWTFVIIALLFGTILTALLLYKINFFKRSKIIAVIQKHLKVFYYSIILFLITFTVFGLINLILFNDFYGMSYSLNHFAILSFGFSVSWLIGFVVPGSPGGVVVREAAFIVVLNNFTTEEKLVYVIIIVRLLGVIIEIFLFVLGWLILRHHNKYQEIGLKF